MITKSSFVATALAVGMVVALPNTVAAEGMYGSLMGGYSLLQDNTLSGSRDDLSTDVDSIKLDDSYIVGFGLGYRFKEPWRLEIEGTY